MIEPRPRLWLVGALAGGCLAALALVPAAHASASNGAPAALSASATSSHAPARKPKSGGSCSVGQMALNLLNPFSNCEPLNRTGQSILKTIVGLPGTLAGVVATGIMDQVTSWMVQAARTITGWVFKEAGLITKPELDAQWYVSLFSGLAALAAALAGLVALIALASAAIRRDPDALGEVIYGIGRAGIGTSVVVALTIIALTAADGIANDFAHQMPADFYKTLASQWGGSGWDGFGAAALAFLVAFIATIAGLLVWLELIVREAAIYIAVLFFPVALAASIWPALRMWVRRLGMLLLMFVILRPVVVIVLALAGSVTSAGLSFGNGSIPHSVGTILAGVVIFALAAFTPWALMFLVGTEIGAMNSRASTGGAPATAGRSTGGSSEGGLGGGLSGAPVLAGAELATAGAGAGQESTAGSGGGLRLSSLGGSGGSGGASGPIAAAAGWVGGVAGSAGRIGGQLSQHAAARVQVAGGRSGVAPGGVVPASIGGFDGSGRSRATGHDPEPARPDGAPSVGSSSANGTTHPPEPSPGQAKSSLDPPSPVDAAAPPPSPADDAGIVPTPPSPAARQPDEAGPSPGGPPPSAGERDTDPKGREQ